MGFFEAFAAGLAGIFALVPSYGVAIILLTVVVRLLLLPLSIKQTRSMREMQRIQPEVKKLQAKYKGDRQKLNEEMMKLYKEHGVNPAGGCLPLLMQMPVFIALYQVLYRPLKYMGYRQDGGDWVADRAAPVMDAVRDSALAQGLLEMPLEIHRFLGVFRLDCLPAQVWRGEASEAVAGQACGSGPLSFIPYLLLILAMGFTTYYQQRQMMAKQPTSSQNDAMAQQARLMGRIMPIMLMVFSFNFPAGLTLYWLTSNVWTIGQQRLMLHVAPPVDNAAADGDGKPAAPAKDGNTNKKPGGTSKTAASVKGSSRAGSKPSNGRGTTSPSKNKRKKR